MRTFKRQTTANAGPARINRAHSRAVGLCFFAPLRDSYPLTDFHSGQVFTSTGLSSKVVTRAGFGLSFGTSNYADFVKPPEIGATTPFTVAWTQEARSTASYSTVLQVNFGTAGADSAFVIYQNNIAADAYNFTAGPRMNFGAHCWSSSFGGGIGVVTDNRMDRFVLRCAGGSQSTTSSDFTLYRNGVLITQGTRTSFSLYTSAGARIGARDGGSDPWEGAILDMRMWARVLSDDEAQRESVQDLVGELYEPRRILIPVSTAAPSGFLPAWIRRPQRTVGAGVI